MSKAPIRAVLTAEVVVDAHRGDNGFGGDGAHGDSVKPVAQQHDLGRVDQGGLHVRGGRANTWGQRLLIWT